MLKSSCYFLSYFNKIFNTKRIVNDNIESTLNKNIGCKQRSKEMIHNRQRNEIPGL